MIGVVIVGVFIFSIARSFTFPGIFRDREVEVRDDQIIIQGQWGVTVNKEEISKVVLEKRLPIRIRRSGGNSINKMIMGSYKV